MAKGLYVVVGRAPHHVLIFGILARLYSMSWLHVGHVAEMRTILNDINGLEEKGDDGEQEREGSLCLPYKLQSLFSSSSPSGLGLATSTFEVDSTFLRRKFHLARALQWEMQEKCQSDTGSGKMHVFFVARASADLRAEL